MKIILLTITIIFMTTTVKAKDIMTIVLNPNLQMVCVKTESDGSENKTESDGSENKTESDGSESKSNCSIYTKT